MRRSTYIAILLAASPFAVAAPACAEPLAADGGHDIGALVALAEEHYDLERTDAVVLLDGLRIAFFDDGTRKTTVHRIVWIATELATETYADLRVPYDSDTSTLDVEALRTWRDGRWWPDASEINPTAVVETTPSALSGAFDYTAIRESMLLHDGVEIPCILETLYSITERRPPEDRAYGLWLIPKSDPCVRTELSLSVARGSPVCWISANGASEPEIDTSDPGRETYGWSADLVARLPRPLTEDPAGYVSHVEWSTWESGSELGSAISASLNEAAVLDGALRDSVARLIEHEPTLPARAAAVAGFVNETTRHVAYDDRFWSLEPRTAVRTWETAYGHRLDRAVLAAALFREAGVTVSPAFRTEGYVAQERRVIPSLARYEGIALRLSGDELTAYYDPSTGRLEQGVAPYLGRDVWLADRSTATGQGMPERGARNAIEVRITLEPSEDDGWTGTGYLRASGGLSPYGSVVGLGDELAGYLGRTVGSILSGTELATDNVARLDPEVVVAGFSFSMADPDEDDRGRLALIVGDPEGGPPGPWWSGAHLYTEERDSPLPFPGPVSQEVRLRFRTGDREVVRLPEPGVVENAAGRFELKVEHGEEGWVTVTRRLTIDVGSWGRGTEESTPRIDAGRWPHVRALLLEETAAANRTILLR